MDFGIILSLIIFIIFILYLYYIKNKNIEKIGGETVDEEKEKYNEDIYEVPQEPDTFSFDELPQFNFFNSEGLNHIMNICGDASGTIFNNLSVSKEFKIRGKDIKYYAANALYPIGSFYVQYPDKNSNTLNEAFPETQSPAYLFGGKWEEQWPGESVFFRTRSATLPYDNENRDKKGLQEYALKRIQGSTQTTQTNRGEIVQPTKLFSGNFLEVRSDSSRSSDWGVFNRLDNGFQSLVSDKETRARNRLFKVWKRILDADDVFYDKEGKIIKLS
jgi:hypothetical protein